MIELFEDQDDTLVRLMESLGRHKASVLVAPTGAGKTVMAMKLIEISQANNVETLFLVHRGELIDQTLEKAGEFGIEDLFGVIAAGKTELPWKLHHIAMVQSLVRRLHKTRINPKLIVIDEAHHAAALSYVKILLKWPDAWVVGLTATPERPDGKPLDRVQAGDEERPLFTDMVLAPTLRQLINMRRLSDYDYKALDTGITGEGIKLRGNDYSEEELEKDLLDDDGRKMANVMMQIKEFCPGRKWIAAGPTIKASKELEALCLAEGLRVRHVDGDTPDEDRRRAVQAFRGGEIDGLLGVQLFLEGLDVPDADCAVLYRHTKSHVVWLQFIGRVLRYVPGKTAVVLDCCNAWSHFDQMPCDDWNWTLEGKRRKSGGGLVTCQECFLLQPRAPVCAYCGGPLVAPKTAGGKREKKVEIVEELLVDIKRADGTEIEARVTRKNGKLVQETLNGAKWAAYKGEGLKGLVKLADQLGFNPKWAQKHYTLMKKKEAPPDAADNQ